MPALKTRTDIIKHLKYNIKASRHFNVLIIDHQYFQTQDTAFKIATFCVRVGSLVWQARGRPPFPSKISWRIVKYIIKVFEMPYGQNVYVMLRYQIYIQANEGSQRPQTHAE